MHRACSVVLLLLLAAGTEAASVTSLSTCSTGLAGAHLIAIHGKGFSSDQFNMFEDSKGNVVSWFSDTGEYACDVQKESSTDKKIVCYTKHMPEGEYQLKVSVDGVNIPSSEISACTLTVKQSHTPTIDTITHSCEPGSILNVTGKFFTDKYGSNIASSSNGRTQKILRVYSGGSECSLKDPVTQKLYGIELEQRQDGRYKDNGYLLCRMQGTYVGNINVSIIIEDFGRTDPKLTTKILSAESVVYMTQTYAVITNVNPNQGSVAGGTNITVTGRNFDKTDANVKIDLGGVPCLYPTYHSQSTMTCISPAKPAQTKAVYPGGRGVTVEKWSTTQVTNLDDILNLTSTASDYTKMRQERMYYKDTTTNNQYVVRLSILFKVTETGTYRVYVAGSGGAQVHLDPTGGTNPGSFVATCVNTCSSYNKVSEDYQFSKGQLIYIVAAHRHVNDQSYVKVMVQRNEAWITGDLTGAVKQEQLKVHITSQRTNEVQALSLSGFGSTAYTATVKTLELTNIDTTAYFRVIIFGVASEWIKSVATASDIERSLKKIPMMKDVISVAPSSSDAKFDITFDTDMGHIPLTSITTAKLPSDCSLSISVSDKTPGVAGLKHLTLQLMPNVLVPPVDYDTTAEKMSNALKTAIGAICPLDFYDQEAAKYTEDFESQSLTCGGDVDMTVEAFCGRSSVKNPACIFTRSTKQAFSADLKLCYAYQGNMSDNYRILCLESDGGNRTIWPATNLATSESWNYTCVRLSELVPQECVKVASIQFTGNQGDHWLDAVTVTEDTTFYKYGPDDMMSQIRKQPRLGGQLVVGASVVKAASNFEITLISHDCGYDFPLIQPYGAAKSGDVFSLRSGGTVTAVKSSSANPPITGSVTLGAFNKRITVQARSTSQEVQQAFEDQSEFVKVIQSGNCSDFHWDITWSKRLGDLPAMTLESIDLDGNNVQVQIDTVQNGSTDYPEVGADMSFTVFKDMQVMAYINNIPTACDEGQDCSFTYSNVVTPVITEISPLQGSQVQSTILTVSGTGFTAAPTVLIGSVPCVNPTFTATEIQCTVGNGPSGPGSVTVHIAGVGNATSTTSDQFTVQAGAGTLSPAAGSLGGGTDLTIAGFGFATDASVTVGGKSCQVTGTTLPGQVVCVTPPSDTAGAVDVVVTSYSQSLTSTTQFNYDQSLTPELNTADTLTSGVIGGGTITLTGVGFGSSPAVLIGDEEATVIGATDTVITATIPSQGIGSYQIKVKSGTDGYAAVESATTGTKVNYILNLDAISPDEGSLYGGTEITGVGQGFGTDASLLNVSVGPTPCAVFSVTDTQFKCRINDTSSQHVVKNTGYSSLWGDGFAWNPATLDVKVGDVVKFDWSGKTDDIKIKMVETVGLNGDIKSGGWNSGDATKEGSFSIQVTETGEFWYKSCDDTQAKCFYGKIVSQIKDPSVADVTMKVNNFEANYNTQSGATVPSTSGGCGSTSSPIAGCSAVAPSGGSADKFHFTFTECQSGEVTEMTCDKDMVTLEGTGWSSTECQNVIIVGDHPCPVTSVTATTVTCQIDTSSTIQTNVKHKVLVIIAGRGISIINVKDPTCTVPPFVSSLSPASGSSSGGAIMTINGVGLQDATVQIDRYSCQVTQQSFTTITCIVPSGTVGQSKPINVITRTNAVVSCSQPCQFIYTQELLVSGINPTALDGSVMQTLTIDGNGFGSDVSAVVVKIGSENCGNLRLLSDSEIKCDLQYISVGVYPINVTISGKGLARTTTAVTVEGMAVLNSVNPTGGSENGNTSITLYGNGFVEGETTVTIGGSPCDVSMTTLSTIMCWTPSGSGTKTVVVSVRGTAYSTQLDYLFDASKTPTVTGVSPSTATSNTQITITGTHFSENAGENSVTVGEAACSVISQTSTQIVCNTGLHPAGSNRVIVIRNGGYGKSVGVINFTYELTTNSIDPSSGGLAGGQPVSISGQGFESATSVAICGQTATVDTMATTSSLLVAETPQSTGDVTVSCDVVVTSGSLSATLASSYTYDANLTPEVTSVRPGHGGTGGGTLVTIEGSGFGVVQADVDVSIEGVPCVVQSVTATEVTCLTGARQGSVKSMVDLRKKNGGKAKQTSADYEYLDIWSSSLSWGGSPPPVEEDFVVIPSDQTILLDVTTPTLKMLLIQGGKVIFDEKDIELHAEYILITDNGTLQVGTERDPFQHQASITLHGDVRSTELPLYGSKVLAVRSGNLQLHGKPLVRTWTELAQTADVGATVLTLQEAVNDWSVGDEIVIATTGHRHSQAETEVRTITGVSGNGLTLTLDSGLTYKHVGEQETFGNRVVSYRAEVGLLTRNVVVQGAMSEQWNDAIEACPDGFDTGEFATQTCFQGRFGEEIGNDQFGVQIIMHTANSMAQLEYVEVKKAGQAFRLGRYPVHFHLIGDNKGSYVKGLSIHDTFNRAVNIHGTNGLLVKDTVVYNVMGGALFLEDGVEMGNIFQYNLVLFVKASSSLLNDDITPASFWATNANNTYEYNHAAGGTHFGFWYRLLPHAEGPSASVYPNLTPDNIPLGSFKGNVVHSFGWFGVWVFERYDPTVKGIATEAPSPAVFSDTTVWGCEKGFEFVRMGSFVVDNCVFAHNEKAGFEVKLTIGNQVGSKYLLNNTAIIAYSPYLADHHEWSGGDVIGSGIVLSYGSGMETQSVSFYRYNKAPYATLTFTRVQGTCIERCGGFNYIFNDISFIDSTRKLVYDWENQGVLIDQDGSLTGVAGGHTIAPKSSALPSSCTDAPAEFQIGVWTASFCPNTVKFGHVAFNKITPDSLFATTAFFENSNGIAQAEYEFHRVTHSEGNMGLLPLNYDYDFSFQGSQQITNISYTATFFDISGSNFIKVCHRLERKPDRFYYYDGMGEDDVWPMSLNPLDGSVNVDGDWYYNDSEKKFCYLVSGTKDSDRPIKASGPDIMTTINAFKCEYDDCITPDPNSFPPQCSPTNGQSQTWSTFDWSAVPQEDCLTWDSTQSTCLPPSDGDDLLIPAGTWMILDVSPPVLNELRIEGTLEVQQGATGIKITATYIYVFKGQFLIGCNINNPFTGSAVISLRGNHSTPVFEYPSGHSGPNLGSKAIGVFGALMLNGLDPETTWTTITATANAGTSTLTLAKHAFWNVGDRIVVAASRFNPWEAEVAEISGLRHESDHTVLTLSGPLQYDHIFTSETLDTDVSYTMAAEVGLLTRNIRIEGEFYDNIQTEAFGGRVIVSGAQFGDDLVVGYANLSNVHFLNMGQEGFTSRYDPRHALAFKDVGDTSTGSKPSAVVNCSFEDSLGSSVMAVGADNLLIQGNVFYKSVGPAIVTFSSHTQIIGNMISGYIFPGSFNGRNEASNTLVDALISATSATSLELSGNALSSSERACYVGLPESKTPGVSMQPWSDNICHSSLFGFVLFPDSIEQWPAGDFQFSNFTFYKIYLYGMYYNTRTSITISKNKFIDNGIGILPFLIGPSALEHQFDLDQYITIEKCLFVGHSADYDCTKDVVDSTATYYKISVEGTAPGTKVENRPHAFIGMALPSCTSGTNNSPLKPLNYIMNYQSIACQSTVRGCTFANYNSDKCAGNRPVAIATPPSNDDYIHPLHISSTRLFNVHSNNKGFFKEPTLSKINPSDCVDMDCDGYKAVLIKDMDGSYSGTNVKTDIFALAEFEYDGDPRRGVGNYRIPKSMLTDPNGDRIPYTTLAEYQGILRDDTCVKNDVWRSWTCTGFERHLVMLESMDSDTETRRLSPVALQSYDNQAKGYINLINGPQDHGWCSGYTCKKRLSTFPLIMTAGRNHLLHFASTSPKNLRLHMLWDDSNTKMEIGLYYSFPNSLDVYLDDQHIHPKNTYQENGETVYRHPSDSPPGAFLPDVATDGCGTNFYDTEWQLQYIVLCGSTRIDIKTRDAIMIGLSVLTTDDFFGEEIVSNLATFLGVPESKVRILDVQKAGSSRGKRSTTGTTSYNIEIADSPCSNINCTGETLTLTNDELVTIASNVLNAYQNGILSSLMNVTINSMSITEVVPPIDNPSWQEFVEAQNNKRIVQFIDTFEFYSPITAGAEGNVFPQQPKLHFTDSAGAHVSSLGVAAIPWQVQAVLRSGTGSNVLASLTGNTTVDFVGGWANFSDLSLSHSGSGFIIDFNIIFPESNYTLESAPLQVTYRPFKVDLAYTAGNVYTNNPHELRFKVVDTTTNTKVDNLVWNGGVWMATVTTSASSGYGGAFSGTTSVNFDPSTSEVSFNDLQFDTIGIQVLTVTVTSTTGYNLTMAKEVIVMHSALQSMVPEVSQVLAVRYDVDFSVYGNLDFAAGAFMNEMMAKFPLIAFSDLSVAEGSVIITVTISGNTTTVTEVTTGICSDISSGSTFTYNGATFSLSSTMTVNSQQYYGVSCESEETSDSDSSRVALIIGLVIGILSVLALIGIFLFWKLKIVPKTKTHKISKEDEIRYIGTMTPAEDILWREQSFMSIREKSLPERQMPGLSTQISGRSTPMY
ncbi:fibrocystin-L-like isoform X2 [Mizuhopecten yessoensis]|uniref:fibrocystin-L-like isoform X2 n=1 Tax=Mizuhopecten yessoensis TaxID=6573 RepID=UPI000B4582A5|nr:fibrocystin-L-like isoform X2 [Mizuhopecten yessoensis]